MRQNRRLSPRQRRERDERRRELARARNERYRQRLAERHDPELRTIESLMLRAYVLSVGPESRRITDQFLALLREQGHNVEAAKVRIKRLKAQVEFDRRNLD
jgi:hypothetical protein